MKQFILSVMILMQFKTGGSQNWKERERFMQDSNTDTTISIEFYHDVLCAWCYALSPRIRKLSRQYPNVQVCHRSFTLSPTKERISEMFGSKAEGKRQIIEHWKAANINDDEHRINAGLMADKKFDYPYSMPAAMACKAAEFQAGHAGHWDYFDAVQKAHLSDCFNINEPEVLLNVARSLKLDMVQFKKDFQSGKAKAEVESDMRMAQEKGIQSVPSIVINGTHKISGALPYSELVKALEKITGRKNGHENFAW